MESNESFQPWLDSTPGVVDVPDEAVPGRVPQPAERGLQVRQQRRHLGVGQPPPPGVVQQRDPQRCRVDGAVVPFRPGRADPHLVQDLARLLLRARVGAGALPAGQRAQRAGGEIGAERQRHACGPERVAAEQGQIPGGAGGQVVVVGRGRVRGEQPGQVGDAPVDQRGQPVVARAHRRRPPELAGRRRGDRWAARCRRGHLDGGLPATAGRQCHVPPGQHPGRRRRPDLVRLGEERRDHRGPVRDRPAHRAGGVEVGPEGRHRGRSARLDLADVGQVGVELEVDRARQRLPGAGDEADRLAQAAGGDGPVTLHEHGRVRTGVAEMAHDSDEAGRRGLQRLAADRRGLPSVHTHDQPGQHPAVGQVDSGGTLTRQLAVPVGQGQPRRRDHGHQLVQIGLFVPDGRLPRGNLDCRHRFRLAI